MKHGASVRLVEDAIAPVDPEQGKQALDEMRQAGVRLVSAESVLNAK